MHLPWWRGSSGIDIQYLAWNGNDKLTRFSRISTKLGMASLAEWRVKELFDLQRTPVSCRTKAFQASCRWGHAFKFLKNIYRDLSAPLQ